MQAVKNAFRFIKWQLSKFTLFGWLTFSVFANIALSLLTAGTRAQDGFMIAALASLVGMFSMLVTNVLKTQYAEFKKERQSLFDTIKHSDK